MHEMDLVTFFKGKTLSTAGQYLFAESKTLFADENLAGNLVEYDSAEKLPFDVAGSSEVGKLIKDVHLNKRKKDRKTSILDVQIDPSKVDTKIYFDYTDKLFAEFRVENVASSLEHHGFEIIPNKVESHSNILVSNIDSSVISYCRVNLSPEYFKSFGGSLSPRLFKSFDEKRYVDSQIPFFLIVSALNGSSGNY